MKELSKNDLLAIDRYHLANERTLLAYIRTWLGVSWIAILILQTSITSITKWLLFILILFWLSICLFGIYSFKKYKKLINSR